MRSVTVVKALAALGIVAAAVTGVPGSSAATAAAVSWSGTAVHQPSGSPGYLTFANMVCPAKTRCWSAGSKSNSGGTGPMMEQLHKGKFVQVKTAIGNAILEGVGCATPRSCWVAGDHPLSQTRTGPVLEHWNGKRWASVAAPNPPGDRNFLNDVSCPTKRLCYAVGGYSSVDQTPATGSVLIERWNGKKWTRQKPLPAPKKAHTASMNAIDCVSATHCVAVGIYEANGIDNLAYSDVLRGKKWSLHAVSQPFHGHFAYSSSSDLWCTTATHCLMSGFAAPDAQGRVTYTPEAWSFNGKSWKLLKLPSGFRSSGGGLLAATCVKTNDCWVAGYAYTGGGIGLRAVALQWRGHGFRSAKVAQPSGKEDEIDSAACAPHGACFALGDASTNGGPASAFADHTG